MDGSCLVFLSPTTSCLTRVQFSIDATGKSKHFAFSMRVKNNAESISMHVAKYLNALQAAQRVSTKPLYIMMKLMSVLLIKDLKHWTSLL